MPYLRTDDRVRLYYEEHGRGTPLVLAYGIGGNVEMWDVNVQGMVNCIEEFYQDMRKEGGGSIINIGSRMCHGARPTTAAYAASKAGLLALTKTLAVEFVLYASGERQIGDALAKMGIRDGTTQFAVVAFGSVDIATALDALALTRDDSVLEASRQKLRAFGVSKAEIDSVPEDRQADLVLERVAMVDLLK